jgi:hypothetical protein
MMEPGLIAGYRRAESCKGGSENLDTIEIGTRFFERAVELAFYPVDCSVRSHSSPMFLPRDKGISRAMVPVFE